MTCNCNNGYSIFKGDDTNAFGNQFLRINRPSGLADDVGIYKAEFKCGVLPVMTFGDGTEEITFPIDVNLSADQTKLLGYENVGYLKVYDENGLGQTCVGNVTFRAKEQVV